MPSILRCPGSCIVELWDPQTYNCKMIFNIKENKIANLNREDETAFSESRLTSVLPFDDQLWVGTADGRCRVRDSGIGRGAGLQDIFLNLTTGISSKKSIENVLEREKRIKLAPMCLRYLPLVKIELSCSVYMLATSRDNIF